jgi:hypothetical protein
MGRIGKVFQVEEASDWFRGRLIEKHAFGWTARVKSQKHIILFKAICSILYETIQSC